jgi:hypothetical protein
MRYLTMTEIEQLEKRREVLASTHVRAVTARRKLLEQKYVNLAAALAADAEVQEIEKTLLRSVPFTPDKVKVAMQGT